MVWNTMSRYSEHTVSLAQPHLPSVASNAKRALLSLDLEAGFPLDPFFVSVNGGGDLDAAILQKVARGSSMTTGREFRLGR